MPSDTSTDGSDQVDIPITVPPEMAEEMADELERTGSIHINVTNGNAPSLVEQIRWQLEEGQPVTELVDEYVSGGERDE